MTNRQKIVRAVALVAAALALMATVSLATRKHEVFTPAELQAYQMRVQMAGDDEPPPLTEAEFAEFQAALKGGDPKQLNAVVEKLEQAGAAAVAERKRRHRTDEEQARRDHLKAERAKRWGIFLHYIGMGAGTAGGYGPIGWVFGLIGSALGFAVTVGRDAVLLIVFATVVTFCALLAAAWRVARWLMSFFAKGKSNVDA